MLADEVFGICKRLLDKEFQHLKVYLLSRKEKHAKGIIYSSSLELVSVKTINYADASSFLGFYKVPSYSTRKYFIQRQPPIQRLPNGKFLRRIFRCPLTSNFSPPSVPTTL
jgi:hypothetical protein